MEPLSRGAGVTSGDVTSGDVMPGDGTIAKTISRTTALPWPRHLGCVVVAWWVLAWAAAASLLVAQAPDSEAAAPHPASVWQGAVWIDLDGKEWTAASLQGRVVVLDFWATWCLPCLEQLPDLRRLRERFSEDDVVILGVVLDTLERRQLRSFLARHRVTWPQVHAPQALSSAKAQRFGVEAVPTTVLVDRRGRAVARNLKGPALEASIEALVGF